MEPSPKQRRLVHRITTPFLIKTCHPYKYNLLRNTYTLARKYNLLPKQLRKNSSTGSKTVPPEHADRLPIHLDLRCSECTTHRSPSACAAPRGNPEGPPHGNLHFDLLAKFSYNQQRWRFATVNTNSVYTQIAISSCTQASPIFSADETHKTSLLAVFEAQMYDKSGSVMLMQSKHTLHKNYHSQCTIETPTPKPECKGWDQM